MARSLTLLLLMAAAVGGCQSAQPGVSQPVAVAAGDYQQVYRAAVEVLRDYGFRVDRQDYRFGRITTTPQGSPTLVEVWDADNTTLAQAVQSTVSDIQRRATVFLDPVHPEPAATQPQDALAEGEQAPASAQVAGEPSAYELRVEVLMERRQLPVRRLTRAVGRNVFDDLRTVPTEWRQRGIDAAYWEPIGRDPHLESRLLRDILQRVGQPEQLALADRPQPSSPIPGR